MRLLPVQWKVVTRETLPREGDYVFFALTPREYENLAMNWAEAIRWATEAAWRLNYYAGRADTSADPPVK